MAAEASSPVAAQISQTTVGRDLIIGAMAALNLEALEVRYLHGLEHECDELPLAGDAPPDVGKRRAPRLQRVYVDLTTTEAPTLEQAIARLPLSAKRKQELQSVFAQVQKHLEEGIGRPLISSFDSVKAKLPDDEAKKLENQFNLKEGMLADALTQPLSVIEVMHEHPQLVVLGEPGGGKSTLTRRLAGMLACATHASPDEAEQAWQAEITTSFGRWLLPVRIVLSRWASRLSVNSRGTADDLIEECLHILGETARLPGAEQKAHFIHRLLANPPTVLLLLDGLDEVANEAQRERLQRAVADFCRDYGNVPLLVTCRIRSYMAWLRNDTALPLPAFVLGPLTDDAIDQFIERWHAELTWAGIYTETAATHAQQRLRHALADTKRRDLQAMAKTPLLLTMMARVNYSKGLPDSRAALYEEYVRQLLWEWERLKQDDQGQPTNLEQLLRDANVAQTSLERALSQLAYSVHEQASSQDAVDIARTDLRETLERIHPGREEAKAAWAVRVLRLIDDRTGLIYAVDQRTYRFSHRTFQEYLAARWLAGGKYLPKFKEKIDQEQWREVVLLALGYQIAVQSEYDSALDVIDELLPDSPTRATDWQRLLLLGEAYVHLLTPQRAGEAEQQRQARRIAATLPPLLTQAMHDRDLPATQRLEAGLILADLDLDPPGLDDFVPAPDGQFKIARYPVTNKQYRRFVEAGGYAEKRWWGKKGWAEKEEYAWTEPRFWDNPRFNRATQPVVGMSWYEACAYCAWLTAELRHNGTLDKNAEVRLPTEAEWMQAAHADERVYPWGKEFDPANANTEESQLEQTTPVHLYPGGITPEGVWDLSGNVWEWTNDVAKEGWIWVKGGAYYRVSGVVTSSARGWSNPYSRNVFNGFRCVVVPISRS